MNLVQENRAYRAITEELTHPAVNHLLVLIGVGVDVASTLTDRLKGTCLHEELGYVVTTHDARRFLGIVGDDLVLIELEVLHGIAQCTVQNLAVKLPEEC